MPIYFDLPVFVPQSVALEADAKRINFEFQLPATSRKANVTNWALPWQSWVLATAWYPDANPVTGVNTHIVCNLLSKDGSESPRPVSVNIVQIIPRVEVLPQEHLAISTRRLDATAQVLVAAVLFEQTVGGHFLKQHLTRKGGVESQNASSLVLTELAPTASIRGRRIFLLHDSVQVWERTCSLPLRWASAPAVVNGFNENAAGDEANVVHFGIFLDSTDQDSTAASVVDALKAVGFEVSNWRRSKMQNLDTGISGKGDDSSVVQIDLTVPTACASLKSPLITGINSPRASAERDIRDVGVFPVNVEGRCPDPEHQQLVFFDKHDAVTLRLNFLRQRLCFENRGFRSTASPNFSYNLPLCDSRRANVQIQREWSISSTKSPTSSSTMPGDYYFWTGKFRTKDDDEWISVTESQVPRPLCWIDFHGLRVPAQCRLSTL